MKGFTRNELELLEKKEKQIFVRIFFSYENLFCDWRGAK